MTTPRPKRRTRRFLQFSLRALLVFVLLVSVGMSWFAVKLQKARRQREAVEAIEKAGGWVTYDYQFNYPIGSTQPTPEPAGPTWLPRHFRDDLFAEVVGVYLPTILDDETAQLLKRFPRLPQLHIDTSINGAGLENVKELTNLQVLNLWGHKVTDYSLEQLEDASSLRGLNLVSTQVTPEGVKKLQEALPDCEIVSIHISD